jgi:hypothetical protein
MPEGGAERDVEPQKKPAKKKQAETKGAETAPSTEPHEHTHSHGGKEHTHTHSHAGGEGHDHLHDELPPPVEEHEQPHLHEHGHKHRHGTLEHEHPHRHEHEHEHPEQVGHAHDHLHEEDAEHEHEHSEDQLPKSKLRFDWAGYLKVIGEVIENDPYSTFIGRNDGFRVGNARLGVRIGYGESLYGVISLEASVPRTEDFNQPNAELTVGPRDLFIGYVLSKHASIAVGRFKAPYDIGELENEGERTFIDAPIESRGVAPTQGFELEGLRQGRQMGIMLHNPRLGLSKDGFDFGYALAVTNGKTENLALNDNDRPAGFARFTLYFSDWLALNAGGFTETRTTGDLPNFFDEEVIGAEGSLALRLADLRIEGQLLYQRTNFPTAGTPHVNSIGFHAQWSYRLWGLEAAYRFAYYDPNDRFEVDAVNEHTLGLSYYVGEVPLRFSLNATLAQEQRGRELENNRLAMLAQYNF